MVFKKLPSPIRLGPRSNTDRAGAAWHGRQAEWIAITDGRNNDDKPQFSPDGNTVYFTSTRDGYLCIWAQRLIRDQTPTGATLRLRALSQLGGSRRRL